MHKCASLNSQSDSWKTYICSSDHVERPDGKTDTVTRALPEQTSRFHSAASGDETGTIVEDTVIQ